jgi:hypothetical protein
MDCAEIDFFPRAKTDFFFFSCGVKVRHVLCPTVVAIVEGLASLGQVDDYIPTAWSAPAFFGAV